MKLFGEKVIHTSTNSSFNVLQVEHFTEIFFDVFEIELNKKKYPVEKVSEYNGNPVVSIPVVVEGVKRDYPFVLTKGTRELLFNPKNTMEGLESAIASAPVIEETYVDVDGPNVFEVLEKNTEILEQIKEAKRDAELSVKRLQKQKADEFSLKTKERENILKETLRDAKAHLLNEFLGISEKLKREILDTSSNQWDELKETVNNKIELLSDGLYNSVNEDFENATAELDVAVRKLVQELHSSSVLPKLDKGLKDIATDIVEKVGTIEENLDKKLQSKAEASLLEEVAQGLDAIRESNIELNNTITKGVNKALSRVGNVKLHVDQVKEELTESVNDKIRNSVAVLTDYFDNKVIEVEEKTTSISEDERKYFLDLINNSRQSLLAEIQQVKTEAPIEYIIESRKGTSEKVDLGSLKAEYDKIISDKFANAIVDLRKYVAVYASGGGTNATQYQDGGTMYGNLTVMGTVSASQFIGPGSGGGGGTANALPLSGGSLTGPLSSNSTATFTGGLSAGGVTLTEVLSAEMCPTFKLAANWVLPSAGWTVDAGDNNSAIHGSAFAGKLIPSTDLVCVIGTVYKVVITFSALGTGGLMTLTLGEVTKTYTLVAGETSHTAYIKAAAVAGLALTMATAVRCTISVMSVKPVISGGERVTGLVEYASGTSHLYADAAAKDAHRTAMGVGTGDAVTLASISTSGASSASGYSVTTTTTALAYYYNDRATSAPYEAWQSLNAQVSSSGTPIRCPGGFKFSGTAWNTGGAGSSKTNSVQYEFLPVSGNPTSGLFRIRNVAVDGDTGNTSTIFSVSTSGNATIPGTLGVTGAATITGLTTCNGGIQSGTGAGELDVVSASGALLGVRTVEATSAAMSGATVTVGTNLIPAGSYVFGVTVRVMTLVACGDSTFKVGDGTDADAWGAAIAVAAGTASTSANFNITAPAFYTAATNVVLTANGTAFTAGVVKVAVHYITLTGPTA